MTPEQHAAWLAGTRAILDAYEAHPELPVPYIAEDRATFYLTDRWGPAACQALAAAEVALAGSLGVTFAGAPDEGGSMPGYYYNLTAVLPGGRRVEIKALTAQVAEQKVTGQTVTEVTEWVRRPAEEPGQGEGEAAP